MTYKVGSKGQVVIEKAFRERLGVEPGWQAVQRLVDDHVEIYFVPPASTKSLKGTLAPPSGLSIGPNEWADARDKAWEAHVQERFGRDKDMDDEG